MNLLLRSTDGRYCHLSASQAEKMRPCHFVQQVELRCWPRASRTDGSPSAPPPPPTLKQTYTWEHTMTGRIRGVLVNSEQGRQSAIDLEQDSNIIQWSIAANNIEDQRTDADCHRLRKEQRAGDIVFYANPLIHGFPWTVPDTIANKHALLVLKKQPFRHYKGSDGALTQTLETLRNLAEGNAWQTAAL